AGSGARGLEGRGGDAAGDGHAADEVAERRPLLERRLAGRRESIGDSPACPERHAVVPPASRVGPAPALTGAARVDQPRIDRAQVVPGDAQPLAGVVEEAGEEDVGAGDEPVEQGAALRMPEIDADAALVATEVLDEEVASGRAGDQP